MFANFCQQSVFVPDINKNYLITFLNFHLILTFYLIAMQIRHLHYVLIRRRTFLLCTHTVLSKTAVFCIPSLVFFYAQWRRMETHWHTVMAYWGAWTEQGHPSCFWQHLCFSYITKVKCLLWKSLFHSDLSGNVFMSPGTKLCPAVHISVRTT